MITRWKYTLLTLVLLVGCTTPTSTPLPVIRTNPPQRIASITPFPTSTRKFPSTATNLLIMYTSTVTASYTASPTLSPNEAKTLIIKRTKEPTGCKLPCLWGFFPGKSEVETARRFVEKFGIGDFRYGDVELGAHNYDSVGGVWITYPKDEIYINIDWAYSQSNENTRLKLLTMRARSMVSLGISPTSKLPLMAPIYGNPSFNEELTDYLVPSILATYGQPSEVYVTTWQDDPDRQDIKHRPFSLALVYQEKGIFIEYESIRETKGDRYFGCPDKSEIFLATWDPQTNLPLDSLIGNAGSLFLMGYSKPITDGAFLTVSEFYQTFKDSKNTTCMETPRSLWLP